MNPNISVIILVYNTERYVEKCIESTQAHTYTDWQWILVNHGSKDKILGSAIDMLIRKNAPV